MINEFLKFEKDNDLFLKQIDEVNYWHLIRFDLYNFILSKRNNFGKAHFSKTQENKLAHLKVKFNQMKYLISKNFYFDHTTSEVLVFSHSRKVVNRIGKYEDIYTSFIDETFKARFIEEPINNTHFEPNKLMNIRYNDIINFEFNIKKFFVKKSTWLTQSKIEELVNILKKIELKFKIELDINHWVSKISNKILLFKIAVKKYEKYFLTIRPKIIIEVVSYTGTKFAVNHVAKKLNIPTVELQHGLMGQEHIAYNIDFDNEISTFPDYIFTFGDYWKESTNFPLSNDKILSIGFPYFEENMNKYIEKNIKSKNILFISQGTIGKDLSKFAVLLEKNIKEKDYQIIYKLHPGEYDNWKENYPWLLSKNSNIRVIDHNGDGIYPLFKDAVATVGVYSTALIEGLGYNLKTYVLNIPGFEHMELFLDRGDMIKIERVEDLLNTIDEPVKIDNSYYWRRNSIANFNNAINRIIGNTNEKN